jgi:hypothetical protein
MSEKPKLPTATNQTINKSIPSEPDDDLAAKI